MTLLLRLIITEIDGNGILRLEGAGSAATVFGGVSIVGDVFARIGCHICNKVAVRPTYPAMSIKNGASAHSRRYLNKRILSLVLRCSWNVDYS